jgi:hypothetical protein
MEKITNFISKNGIIIIPLLLLIMSIQTCTKNGKIKRLTKENIKMESKVDSLSFLIPTEDNLKLNDFKSQYRVYDKINNEMSKLNRQEQMMTFQNEIIIPAKVELESKIKALESK